MPLEANAFTYYNDVFHNLYPVVVAMGEQRSVCELMMIMCRRWYAKLAGQGSHPR